MLNDQIEYQKKLLRELENENWIQNVLRSKDEFRMGCCLKEGSYVSKDKIYRLIKFAGNRLDKHKQILEKYFEMITDYKSITLSEYLQYAPIFEKYGFKVNIRGSTAKCFMCQNHFYYSGEVQFVKGEWDDYVHGGVDLFVRLPLVIDSKQCKTKTVKLIYNENEFDDFINSIAEIYYHPIKMDSVRSIAKQCDIVKSRLEHLIKFMDEGYIVKVSGNSYQCICEECFNNPNWSNVKFSEKWVQSDFVKIVEVQKNVN
jgi:hypothetical protein